MCTHSSLYGITQNLRLPTVQRYTRLLVYCRRLNPESKFKLQWRRVASYLDCRTPAECELRYARLCPDEVHWRGNLSGYRWSPDEDMVCIAFASASLPMTLPTRVYSWMRSSVV